MKRSGWENICIEEEGRREEWWMSSRLLKSSTKGKTRMLNVYIYIHCTQCVCYVYYIRTFLENVGRSRTRFLFIYFGIERDGPTLSFHSLAAAKLSGHAIVYLMCRWVSFLLITHILIHFFFSPCLYLLLLSDLIFSLNIWCRPVLILSSCVQFPFEHPAPIAA